MAGDTVVRLWLIGAFFLLVVCLSTLLTGAFGSVENGCKSFQLLPFCHKLRLRPVVTFDVAPVFEFVQFPVDLAVSAREAVFGSV